MKYFILGLYGALGGFFLPSLQAMDDTSACGKCYPDSCQNYNLQKALDCVNACEKVQSTHANEVVLMCQSRVDFLMQSEKSKVVFPDACGNATASVPIPGLNLTRVEGIIEYSQGMMGGYYFTLIDETGHLGGRPIKIRSDVGENGTGNGVDESVMLSWTPQTYRVLADVNLDTNEVYCLSRTYKLK